MPTILCVDDIPQALTLRKGVLETSGYTVLTAVDGPSAIELSREHAIDDVVLDYNMPGMKGDMRYALIIWATLGRVPECRTTGTVGCSTLI